MGRGAKESPNAGGAETGNTGVYVGSISTLYPTTYGPSFSVKDYGSFAVFNES